MIETDAVRKREVRTAYDEVGGRLYDLRYEVEQKEKYDSILERVSLREEDSVLDAGCGTGLLLERIHASVASSVGLDISGRLLSWADNKLQRFRHVHLVLADSDCLPFRGSVFDRLFAVTLLQNVPDPSLTLGESLRVTKREALIVTSGLKKRYSIGEFSSLLSSVGLSAEIVDKEDLKDFLAICRREH